jgi:hypothetical protein
VTDEVDSLEESAQEVTHEATHEATSRQEDAQNKVASIKKELEELKKEEETERLVDELLAKSEEASV